ncbi:PfkB family carbohydrate kinase [Stutzerimonas azotifigens]|uniref:PfkB family carbohydrate kinase n=1 Tax=Stutzerimonas azotifigens TaxID=291995 RepID=UPI00041AEC9E|nr:PfkB family carbohydrate kinase [Stutzerimonas azotifigens]
MERRTLLSLGSINADFQVRVDASPGSAETLLGHAFVRLSGGKASNTAFLGARFGHCSLLLGRVGDDDLAEQALAPLREAGVDVSAVGRVPGHATGVSLIMVPPDAKKQIVLATNANDCWDEAALDALRRAVEQAPPPACLVLDYEVPARAVRTAVLAAERCGMPVVLDPSFADRAERELFGKLRALVPNAAEGGALAGIDISDLESARRAARQLQREGVPLVALKLSDGGCVLATGEGLWHLPGGAVDPVDATGAGDAFTGALAIALLEGAPPLEAALWGVAAAQAAVTGYGSQPAYPQRDDLMKRVEDLRSKVRRCDD